MIPGMGIATGGGGFSGSSSAGGDDTIKTGITQHSGINKTVQTIDPVTAAILVGGVVLAVVLSRR